jgi:hypothetical protein
MNSNILRKAGKFMLRCIGVVSIIVIIYLATLFFPQPFFAHKVTVNNITVYSDESLPVEKITNIIESAESNIKTSKLYDAATKHRIFIANNNTRWTYFTTFYSKVGGLNYVIFNHNIFLRKADVSDNRLYGPSGSKVAGERTLDYFMAHEISHTLEFQSMSLYKYPLKTNWVLEGYCEYIAYGSESYEVALKKLQTANEPESTKYYTRVRTIVAYMLEREQLNISDIWSKLGEYDYWLAKAVPTATD